jgi:hypothetical protein
LHTLTVTYKAHLHKVYLSVNYERSNLKVSTARGQFDYLKPRGLLEKHAETTFLEKGRNTRKLILK